MSAGSKALLQGEVRARRRAEELQTAMERGLQELRVGKEGIEVSRPLRFITGNHGGKSFCSDEALLHCKPEASSRYRQGEYEAYPCLH